MRIEYELRGGKTVTRCPYKLKHKSEVILVGSAQCINCVYNLDFGTGYIGCSYNVQKGKKIGNK